MRQTLRDAEPGIVMPGIVIGFILFVYFVLPFIHVYH